MNVIAIVGNIGKKPVLSVTPTTNKHVLSFSVAVSQYRPTGTHTDWFRCNLWGTRAEKLAPYLDKGTKVSISGSINFRSYEKNGTTFQTHDINISDIGILSKLEKSEEVEPLNWVLNKQSCGNKST